MHLASVISKTLLTLHTVTCHVCNRGDWFEVDKVSEGLVVTGIRSCAGDKSVNGIQLGFSDGTWTDTIGHETWDDRIADHCHTLNIDVKGGERVTALSFWPTEDYTKTVKGDCYLGICVDREVPDGFYLGAFRIKTHNVCSKKGQDYYKKCDGCDLRGEEQSNVGGGIILGVAGRVEWHIRGLTFHFLKPVTNMEVIYVGYQNLPQIQLKRLDTVIEDNPTDRDQVSCRGIKYTAEHRDQRSWNGIEKHLIGRTINIKYPHLELLVDILSGRRRSIN